MKKYRRRYYGGRRFRRRRFPAKSLRPVRSQIGTNVLKNRMGQIWPDKFVCKHSLFTTDAFATTLTTYNQQRYYTMNFLYNPTNAVSSGIQVQDYDHLATIYQYYRVISWKIQVWLDNNTSDSMRFIMYPGFDNTDLSGATDYNLCLNQKYAQNRILQPLGTGKESAYVELYFPVSRQSPEANLGGYSAATSGPSAPANPSYCLLNMHATGNTNLACLLRVRMTFYAVWTNRQFAYIETT